MLMKIHDLNTLIKTSNSNLCVYLWRERKKWICLQTRPDTCRCLHPPERHKVEPAYAKTISGILDENEKAHINPKQNFVTCKLELKIVPSFVIRPLPSISARFGYTTKGKPPSLPCICLTKQHPLYCLQSFPTRLFHLPESVTVSVLCTTFFQLLRKTIAKNQLVHAHSLSLLTKCHCYRWTDARRTISLRKHQAHPLQNQNLK